MKKSLLLLPIVLIMATGCTRTNDYSPATGATGEQIFQAACAECHADGFELASEMASVEAIAKKIGAGSMGMPKFPNIQGESLTSVSEYVLNSQNKSK